MDDERMKLFMRRNFHELEVSMENALAVIDSAVPELKVRVLTIYMHESPFSFRNIYLHFGKEGAYGVETFNSMTDLRNWLMKKRLLLRQFNLED